MQAHRGRASRLGMKAVVLYGQIDARPQLDEQDVLVQVAAVCRALAELGHDPVSLSLSVDLARTMDTLRSLKPDFVFNLVEAIAGRGEMMLIAPVVLDVLQIPYTGSSTEALFCTTSKNLAKTILRLHGIGTPDWFSAGGLPDDPSGAIPYIVKSVWEHASCGLDETFVVRSGDTTELSAKIENLRSRLGSDCFAETFIEGREINVSLLAGAGEPEILPAAEIRFTDYPPGKSRIVCYRAKWVEESFEYTHTPRSFDFPPDDLPLLSLLMSIARHCWEIFRLRGYARVDFRVDHSGKPWVLEVNANPCLSPDSGFIAAAERRGLTYRRVIERIIGDMPSRERR